MFRAKNLLLPRSQRKRYDRTCFNPILQIHKIDPILDFNARMGEVLERIKWDSLITPNEGSLLSENAWVPFFLYRSGFKSRAQFQKKILLRDIKGEETRLVGGNDPLRYAHF